MNKEIDHVFLYAYVYFTRLRRGQFLHNPPASLDAPGKYEIIVQKLPN